MVGSYRVNVILGKTGSGKSRLLTALLRPHKRLFLVDTMLEHEAIAPAAALEDAYEIVQSGGDFRLSVYPVDLKGMAWCENLAASQPNLAFAVDEYSFWYPTATSLPSRGLMALVRCGRKLHQSVYLTTQSPGCISKQMTGQAAVWVLPMFEPNDCRYVLERTAGTIDPAELEILDGEIGMILQTQVARYMDGKREDFVLHTPTAEIVPVETPEKIPESP